RGNWPVSLDTERLYTLATQDVVGQYGKEFTWELKVQQMGKHSSECARMICHSLQLPITPEEYLKEMSHVQVELFPSAQLLPGAERLVRHLFKKGVPCAIATSSAKVPFDLKTLNHKEFLSLFEIIVQGGSDPEVKHGKPDPDIFLVCASRFKDQPDPKNCLVFEDAPNGVQAALAAGMQVVMVPDPRTDSKMKDGATLVLDSLMEFKPEQFGLPPYDD
ncbi:unnamed protein product, partial [Darwinula stevensoni]